MPRLLALSLLLTIGVHPALAAPDRPAPTGDESGEGSIPPANDEGSTPPANDEVRASGTAEYTDEGCDEPSDGEGSDDEGKDDEGKDDEGKDDEGKDDEGKDDEDELPDEETSLGTLEEPSTVTIEATGKIAESDLPRRLGPAQISINERGDRIGVGFASQLRFDFDQILAADGVEEESDYTLTFRRLRAILSSSFLEGRIRSSLQLNVAPNAFELIDMWLLFVPMNRAALRVGQFKIPFTRYRMQSFAALSLADWSPASRMFGSERQLGLEAFNPRARLLGLEYALGVFTGANARGSHAVGITDLYGETPGNRSDLTDLSAPVDLHPELAARVAKNFGTIDTSANSDRTGGPLRSSLGLSVAWDLRPKLTEDLAVRAAVEWLAKFYRFYVNTIGYIAWFEGREETGLGPWGFLAEGGYRFNRVWELALRYTLIILTQALRDDAKAHAAEQIGNGSDPDKNAQYEGVGEQKSEQDLALALDANIVGNSVKAQLETAWSTVRTEIDRQHRFRIIAQLQFQF